MMSFATRRWIGRSIVVLCSAAAVAGYFHFQPRVPRLVFLTGWILFGLMLLLTAYNARKKLPFLPLLSSQTWLDFHVYAGWVTAVLFCIHLNFRIPTGWFESVLAALFLLVTLSGIAGLVLSRTIPKRLTLRGGEVLFERIPSVRLRLQNEAEALAHKIVPDTKSTIVAEFYAQHLHGFFSGRRNFWPHMVESRRPLNTLLAQIDDLNRYLGEKEREALGKISKLVHQKDGLDYHEALQWILKSWLFIHIPLTYSLLIFTFVHIVLVFAFSGGAP